MLKRTFDDCFREGDGMDDDFVEGEEEGDEEENWKAPIMSDESATGHAEVTNSTTHQDKCNGISFLYIV